MNEPFHFIEPENGCQAETYVENEIWQKKVSNYTEFQGISMDLESVILIFLTHFIFFTLILHDDIIT